MTNPLLSPSDVLVYLLVGLVLLLAAGGLEWLARHRAGAEIWAHQLSVLLSAAAAAAIAVGVLATWLWY
jgi:hypothetical protein